jgi:hypothetical protein
MLAERQLFRHWQGFMHSRRGKLGRTMLLKQSVQGFLLSDLESAGLDARMVYTQQRVDVVHGLRAHVGELLDLGRGVLDLLVGEFEPKLLDA